MNDKIEIGDLVSLDIYGNVVKATSGDGTLIGTCLDSYGRAITVDLNKAVSILGLVRRAGEEPEICIVCKRTSHELTSIPKRDLEFRGLGFDHPFIRNNLELLEWKDKEKMKQL